MGKVEMMEIIDNRNKIFKASLVEDRNFTKTEAPHGDVTEYRKSANT